MTDSPTRPETQQGIPAAPPADPLPSPSIAGEPVTRSDQDGPDITRDMDDATAPAPESQGTATANTQSEPVIVGSAEPLAIGVGIGAGGTPVVGAGSPAAGTPKGRVRVGDRIFAGMTTGMVSVVASGGNVRVPWVGV